MSSNESHTLQAKLYDPQGNIVWNGNMQDTFEIPVENTCQWSSEFKPVSIRTRFIRYKQQKSLKPFKNKKLDFEKFTLEYGIMKLNGKRIVFHGINRHEWDPKTGRCLSQEQMEEDIHILKSLNINAIKTSLSKQQLLV